MGKILLWGESGEAPAPACQPAIGMFVNLAGGRRARIVVLSQPSGHEHERQLNDFTAALRWFGVRRVDVIDLPAGSTSRLALGSTVPHATGFLIAGSEPSGLRSDLAGSVLLSEIRSRYQSGAEIAALGASAAILGREVAGVPYRLDLEGLPNARKESVTRVPGLSFLPECVVDPSLGRARNLDGLLSALAANPALFGLGIEPGTAVLANSRGQITALGDGCAIVVDGRDARADTSARRLGEVAAIAASRIYVLREGKRFDPHARNDPSLLQRVARDLPVDMLKPAEDLASAGDWRLVDESGQRFGSDVRADYRPIRNGSF